MRRLNHIRCPLCGKLSRQRNFDNSPHKIEIRIQEIGGDKYIRWYKADDEAITKEVIEYIIQRVEILLASLKKEDQWHILKNTLIRVVPSTSYSMTSVLSSNQKSDVE
jgi:hypothetical protein